MTTYATRQRRKKSDATFDLQAQMDQAIPAIEPEQADAAERAAVRVLGDECGEVLAMLGLRGVS